MKKLMLLGGLRYLIPVIEAAHQRGYYVITCDYLPNNIAHKFSDEYIDVSVIDKEAVLQVAKNEKIDGIMSFAVDPGVVSASYVQEKMGLPSVGPYESVCILQNKDKFRAFLADNNFNVPRTRTFTSVREAIDAKKWYKWPVIIKPTDSAGSKGVSRIDQYDELIPALNFAFEHSISGKVIVEEFIEKQGCSSDTDCFSIDGRLTFTSFSAQRFDRNASNEFVPAAYSWPSTMSSEQEAYLTGELQRLLTLLNMNTSIYNVETRIGKNGVPYIMEVSPRGGGNRLAEMIRMGAGVDLITASVCAAIGDPIPSIEQKQFSGHWAEVILHANKSGVFKQLNISCEVRPFVRQIDLWVKPGDPVCAFDGADEAIGTLVLCFDTVEWLEKSMNKINEWCDIAVE